MIEKKLMAVLLQERKLARLKMRDQLLDLAMCLEVDRCWRMRRVA